MGLDMYAWAVPAHDKLPDIIAGDRSDVELGEQEDLATWRKHPYLHGWMQRLYWERKLGHVPEETDENWNEFNLVAIRLTKDNLATLEAAVKTGTLPPTTGFFFGGNASEHYRENDLKFIADARVAIDEGKAVYYDSWW